MEYWALLAIVLAVLLIGFIFIMAVIAMGVWLFAAYKWITRKRWANKTPNGNRRV